MGKYQVTLKPLEEKLARGWALPRSFHALALHCRKLERGTLGWFQLRYTDPKHLIGTDVRAELVPFMKLPDGGFVGFWFRAKGSPTIVSLLSEGESLVVGVTWEDFLERLLRGKTGLDDLDDRQGDPGDISSLQGLRYRPKPLQEHQRAFRAWLKAKAPKPEKLTEAQTEGIRAAILRVLKKRVKQSTDTETLVINFTNRTYDVKWYAGGLVPFPDAEALRAPLTELRQMLGRSLKKSELVVWGNGTVIFEKNTFLGKHMKI